MKKNYLLIRGIAIILFSFLIFTNLSAQLYINEFMASNDVSFPGPQGDYPDWIEIYNAGTEAVMLGGYYMSDVLDDPAAMFQVSDMYPDSVTVPAGGFIVFYANKGEESSVMNLNFKLSGSGESIGLWNPESVVLDELTYTEQTTDVSYGRYPDGTDVWGFMEEITPGSANSNPAPAAIELYINEFMASNDVSFPGPQGDYPDWIEIYNAGTEAVMLGGYYMSDILDDPAAMFQVSDMYPDSVTVPAGGFIVFYANKGEESSVMNLNFKLSGSGESIGLWNPESVVLDELTYTEQTTDVSYGRYPDGTDVWGFMEEITPGSANSNPAPAAIELYINEFMASNDVSFPGPQGDYPDWIEIYNAGTEAVNLAGYYMYDTLDVTEALPIPSTYPDSVTVQPDGFILFYANKGQESSVLNLNFKLSGGGEQIGLWNPDQELIEGFTYEEQITDTSFGRYMDGTENWYFMSDITPGASNTNPNIGPTDVELYINEFMASNDYAFPGPQGDYPDWVEVYNAGTEPVMLGGYYMADVLDDPAAMFQISDMYPDSVTVPAGGFLVFYANGDPDYSVMNLDFKLSGGGEQIGFWAPDQAVIDTLSYTAQIADTSYGRYVDGTNNWFMMPEFTPGAANINSMSIIEIEDIVSIAQNFPNPFSTKTNIKFTLEQSDKIVVSIFDIRGVLVSVIADDNYSVGTHNIVWDASNLQPGYYFYTFQTSKGIVTNKASVIR